MTDRTETLLRETFASRESLADPDVARELAAAVLPRRRRWPAYVAAAAAVAVVAAVAGVLAGGGDHATEPPDAVPTRTPTHATTPTPVETRTYAQNRQVAVAEAKRVVRLVPLPAGATVVDPDSWAGSGMGLAPADPKLVQARVWTVPADAATVSAHLRSHRMEGARAFDDGSSSSDGGPLIPAIEYRIPSPDPEAMIPTTVVVEWAPHDGGTIVRAETFTAARSVRTPQTVVPEDVTAVTVDRVASGRNGHNRRLPTVHVTAAEDRATVEGLVAAVNALPGSIRPDQVVSCPAQFNPPTGVTLTFATPDGTITAELVTGCLGQVTLTRDGVPVQPTLDPGDLVASVNRLLP